MPQLPDLDEFPYLAQDEDRPECVPACVAIVCEYLGLDKEWDEICEELDYHVASGTEFERIAYLSGVEHVVVRDTADIEFYLGRPPLTPVIANLYVPDTAVLGYSVSADIPLHAVVVVGIDEREVRFIDPLSHVQKSTFAPQVCRRLDFNRAWMEGYVLRPLKADS
jgi:hypothetical protein